MPRSSLWVLAVVAAIGGCAAIQRDSAQETENHLSAAGFTVLPASTPQRQQMLATLPPNRISQRIEGERVSYLYPDPVLCHCLYAGGQGAFGRYQADAQARRLASDQMDAARLNSDFAWDYGPWGGYGPWYR